MAKINCISCGHQEDKVKNENIAWVALIIAPLILLFVTGLDVPSVVGFTFVVCLSIYILFKKPSKNFICPKCLGKNA